MIKEEIKKYIICDMCTEEAGTYYYKMKIINLKLIKSEFEICYNCANRLEVSFPFLNKYILGEVIQYSIQEWRDEE